MDKDKVKAALEAALMASKYGPTRRSRLSWVLKQAGLGLDEANRFISDAIQARVLAEIDFIWVLMTPSGVALTQDFDKLSAEYDWPDTVRRRRIDMAYVDGNEDGENDRAEQRRRDNEEFVESTKETNKPKSPHPLGQREET